MRKSFDASIFSTCCIILTTCFSAWGHVPALLLPIKGTPISSYFIGQAEISRAVYSELTKAEDFFVVQLNVKGHAKTTIEILTPVCPQVPSYEDFQPSVLILKGDLPWKQNGESNENFGKQSYWVGGKARLKLRPGLYALVVFNTDTNKGNFTLGINEKESWTPDLYKYVAEVIPKIAAGICDPKGFSGEVKP